jgi:hypothetical protein
LFALVSTVVVVVSGTAGVIAELSTFTFVESDVVDSVLDESSQAAKTDATANANNTFFIFGVLIINYLPLIPYLKKGNPLIYTNFTPFSGYFSLIIVLIIAL